MIVHKDNAIKKERVLTCTNTFTTHSQTKAQTHNTHSRIMADNLYKSNSVKFPTGFVWHLSLGVYIWSC